MSATKPRVDHRPGCKEAAKSDQVRITGDCGHSASDMVCTAEAGHHCGTCHAKALAVWERVRGW